MSLTASFLTSVLFPGDDHESWLRQAGRKGLSKGKGRSEGSRNRSCYVKFRRALPAKLRWSGLSSRPASGGLPGRSRNRDGSEHLTPISSGKMAPEQIEALAKVLADANLAGLPAKTGHAAKINPHEVILKFGQKTATLEGLPSRRNLKVAELIRNSAPAHEAAEAQVWERFAHVVQAVESHCQEAKKP